MVTRGEGHAQGCLPILGNNKSLDIDIYIATLLRDVSTLHSGVYTPREYRLDCRKAIKRCSREGISFLTKALPRLARAFDRALTGEISLDCTGFKTQFGVPIFMGSLFKRVFAHDGLVLPTPCVYCIATIRQVLLALSKYELPYEQDQEEKVIEQFEKTEDELLDISLRLSHLASNVDSNVPTSRQRFDFGGKGYVIARARTRLARLFASFDHKDITPSHGPGAVSTKEQLWDKWKFTSVSSRIAHTYAVDEYFYSSPTHLVDDLQGFYALKEQENSARVVLVPKDSRGPRLISCEPLEFQWVQQGLSRAIVGHVEKHPLTRCSVNFTDQCPNRIAALYGSQNGRYATLDLKEASDRVSIGLVQLLFPDPLLGALLDCRSLSTELPGGKVLFLNKFAPMGSALCFPILALCIWSILTAGAPDAYTRERILVYGDDVIVPTAFSRDAIELLEAFGLLVNRAKSCTSGFFRESCGLDAFAGVDVTPLKMRTVWSSHRCPHVLASWISYANSFWQKRYYNMYWYIADKLFKVYGSIPERVRSTDPLSLAVVPEHLRPSLRRWNSKLQKLEHKVISIRPVRINREIAGWSMLLRYFTEGQRQPAHDPNVIGHSQARPDQAEVFIPPFSVRSYTKRKTVKIVYRWR